MWTAADLVAATDGVMSVPFAATGVSIDTRTLQPGDLFVALAGENGDGHDHVTAAFAAGASGALVQRWMPGSTLLVEDTLAALWALGRFARTRFTGRMVAVTGSVGKTTTKEMLRIILSAAGPTHAAVASYNNHWGVPLTLARMPPDAAFAVAEIGTNHPGEIAPLARMVRPHVSVITAVAAAHIGFFGSIEAIANEKASIASGLEPGGISVLPTDCAMLSRLVQASETAGARTLYFGPEQIQFSTADADGTTIDARIGGIAMQIRVNAPGVHMASNALAALTAAQALGVDGSVAIGKFRPGAGRGARRVTEAGLTLLDESYNANGASVRAALAVLATLPGRRVAVLGDMRELGKHGAAEHASLAPTVAASADILFACGPLMAHLFDAVPPGLRGAYTEDAATLAPLVAASVAPGDAVLVKGSLGTRMAPIVRALETAALKKPA
jgi:UDP-N-acetylmuramoyl-tripeptide--D-alanyl-D-alanine ligase